MKHNENSSDLLGCASPKAAGFGGLLPTADLGDHFYCADNYSVFQVQNSRRGSGSGAARVTFWLKLIIALFGARFSASVTYLPPQG